MKRDLSSITSSMETSEHPVHRLWKREKSGDICVGYAKMVFKVRDYLSSSDLIAVRLTARKALYHLRHADKVFLATRMNLWATTPRLMTATTSL
jgi:hypothetical protein